MVAGLVVLTALSFGIEAAANASLMRLFPESFPDQAALDRSTAAKLFMAFYTMLSVVAGGYVTAWLAPQSPVRHAVIMGVIELLMTVGVMLEMSSKAPLWFWILGIALMIPAAWWGARLRSGNAASPAN